LTTGSMNDTKKHYIKLEPDNYWDTCNVAVRYEYGGAWHNEPPPGLHTIINIHWYKEIEHEHRRDYPWKHDKQ
jgi:hypothetical protein